MRSKLTLRLDEELIEFGKRWAKQRGKSLSGIVADYLTALEKVPHDDKDLPPVTRGLLGVARDVDEADYHRYLERKHA